MTDLKIKCCPIGCMDVRAALQLPCEWWRSMASFLPRRNWNWLASSYGPREFFLQGPQMTLVLTLFFSVCLSLFFHKECPTPCHPPPVPQEAGREWSGQCGKKPTPFRSSQDQHTYPHQPQEWVCTLHCQTPKAFLSTQNFMGTGRIGREGLINVSV